MKPAQHVYSREFDKIFFPLQPELRAQIVARITEMGSRLDRFPHHRLTNRSECRLRVGDWRVIYEFELQRNIIYLITLGHRGKIYR